MREVKSNGFVKCVKNKVYLDEIIWIEIRKTSYIKNMDRNFSKKTSKLLNPKRRLFSVEVPFFF